MAITMTVDSQFHSGHKMHSIGSGNLGSSYTTGGESVTPNNVKLGILEELRIHDAGGYSFEHDKTNKKVKAFRSGAYSPTFTGTAEEAVLIEEEVVTIASNTGTLAEVPFYIVAVDVTAGSVTGAFNVIPTGETPLTKQVAVTFTTGVLTFLGTDAVTSVRITYIPQRAGTPFVAANLVVDESVTAAAAKANLANRALGCQYIWNDTNSILCALEPSGEAPTATNTAVFDVNDSSNSSVDTHADDDGDTLKVTYIKYSTLPPDCFIDDTDITLSSEAWDFTGDAHEAAIVVPGMGTALVGEAAAAANALTTWGGPSVTAAAGLARWRPAVNDILTAESAAILTTAISWFRIPASVMATKTPAGTIGALSATTLAEVSSAVDLSGVTFRFEAIGI